MQGIVPTTWEINMNTVNTVYFPQKEGVASKVGSIHMSLNYEDFSNGQLFIESKNHGHLVPMSSYSEEKGHQKYLVQIVKAAEKGEAPLVHQRYELTDPVRLSFSAPQTGDLALEASYNVHLVLPTYDSVQHSVGYKDTITFTFADAS